MDPVAPLILLVDDCPDDTSMYSGHLVAAGFRVITATDGCAAAGLALSRVPDLIVMDLEMPVINGWDATRLLRGDERTRSIPIIALSGSYDAPAVMRAISAGCGRFVPKPCLAAELESVVRSVLARDRDQTSASSSRTYEP
jgi:two-component system, cell cycle response regulator DivK